MNKELLILGGGPSGLAAALFAHRTGIDYTVFEGSDCFGGNCRTFAHGDHYFDSGAHRLHDKDPFISSLFKELLKDDLKEVHAPSCIWSKEKLFDFPLTPFNLISNLGYSDLANAAWSYLTRPSAGSSPSFRKNAESRYGKFLAEEFLINYSWKLWGVDPDLLLPAVSGQRLKGLDLKTFLKEAFAGSRVKTQHIDGSFSYPAKGIGQLVDKLLLNLKQEKLQLKSRITGIKISGKRVIGIYVNDELVPVNGHVISSLPPDLLARSVDDNHNTELQYRNLILCHIPVLKESVSKHATIYFPGKDMIFTRLTEPRNRSRLMSPAGQTALVAEIPCFVYDAIWRTDDPLIIERVKGDLLKAGLVSEKDLLPARVVRLPNAYPVLSKDTELKQASVMKVLSEIENLTCIGRTGTFTYSHLHDHFAEAASVVRKLAAGT